MDDDLRKLVGPEGFLVEEEPASAAGTRPHFLGMTALRRFVIALMVFMLAFLLGSIFLIASGKVAIAL